MSAACDKTASNADKLKIYERGDKLLKQRTQGNWKNIRNTGEKSAFNSRDSSSFDSEERWLRMNIDVDQFAIHLPHSHRS